jgi:hypothetical protein
VGRVIVAVPSHARAARAPGRPTATVRRVQPPGAAPDPAPPDPALAGALASQLAALARELRRVGDDVLAEAPDAGPPPAPEAVATLQNAVASAVRTLAGGVDEAAAVLRALEAGT